MMKAGAIVVVFLNIKEIDILGGNLVLRSCLCQKIILSPKLDHKIIVMRIKGVAIVGTLGHG